ncbi:MAG TPA: hypothetical protein VL944_02215 [Candidatus Acidoferrum sp.]|nr:hypothetical protein [Candidatus Acidoferrum sp.]
MKNQGFARSQAAIDFMTSYGIVILVIMVVIYLILQFGVFSPQVAPDYCTPAPSFSCTGFALFPNGTFDFELSQSLGGSIDITGISCSSEINSTGSGPRYGNIAISGAPQYYPTNGFSANTVLFSNTERQFSVYCYGAPGSTPSKGILGGTYIGYVWLNYTYLGLPGNYPNVQQVVSFSTKYT